MRLPCLSVTNILSQLIMTLNLKKFLLIVFLCSVIKTYSQTETILVPSQSHKSISASYQYGNVIQTTSFLQGDNLIGIPIDKYQSFTLKMLWQNPGYTDWQKVFRAPYYGAGMTIGDLNDPIEIGYPISFFGIFGIPVKRWEKLELYSEFQFGLAINWNYYDPVCNSKNINIGTDFTFHVNFGMNAYYPISKKLDLGAGISFIHFSNGGIERPNKGFNIYGPKIELKYHLNDKINRESIQHPERLEHSNDLFFMLSGSKFQPAEFELGSYYFGLGGFSMIYFTQFSNAFRLGYGADFNCWRLSNALPHYSSQQKELKTSLGIILQPEIIIDKLTLVFGLGAYVLHEKFGSFKQLYERLGFRYELYKNISVGLNVRGWDFYRAEYMEFNLGYRIRWIK
jgi:hypothetical protein